jgi:hypothetical protein
MLLVGVTRFQAFERRSMKMKRRRMKKVILA